MAHMNSGNCLVICCYGICEIETMLSEDVLRYNMPMHILCRPHPPCHTVDIYWNYLLAISYTIISYLINAIVIYRKQANNRTSKHLVQQEQTSDKRQWGNNPIRQTEK